jgi:acylphosphatase
MRVRVQFTGRVQGVGFRATARHIASSHAISGFVRNDHDGGVTLEAQGEPHAVNAYLAELRATMARFIQTETSASLADIERESGFVITR